MSNEFVVLLAIFVSALGAGCATCVIALLKQNQYLKEEVQFLGEQYNKLAEECDLAKENHRRNGDIAREYQVLCGDLEEKVESWQKKAYQQNQAFLLAAPHLTIGQVEKIQKTIQSL